MNIIPFIFDTLPVRAILRDGEPWFVAADIAAALDYAEAKDMTRNLEDDEKGRQIVPTPGGNQEMTVINESGLFGAVLKSRKPEAQCFRRWVTGEVLPSIRKTGSYSERPRSFRLDAHAERVREVFAIAEQTMKARGIRGPAREAAARGVVQEIAPDLLHLFPSAPPASPAPIPPGADSGPSHPQYPEVLAPIVAWFRPVNLARFLVWGADACNAKQRGHIAGWERETAGGNTVFYVLADVFRQEVCRGQDHREVLRQLDGLGLVIKEGHRPTPGQRDTRRFDTRARPPLCDMAGGVVQVYRLRSGVASLDTGKTSTT